MKKSIIAIITASGVGLLGTVHSQASGVNLVQDGKAKAVIVIPDAEGKVPEFAAKELQHHINLATGVTLDIVRENKFREGMGIPIYLGACNAAKSGGIDISELPKNSWITSVQENALFFCGNDGDADPLQDNTAAMGTLLAVYEWLDQQLQARWIWPGEKGTYVPKADTISSGTLETRTGKPTLIHARLRNYYRPNWGRWSWDAYGKNWLARHKADTSVWFLRHRFVRTQSLEYPHAYENYWERFGKEHPDFFAMQPNGKRGPIDTRIDLVQMCVSNPELHKQIIADWLAQRKRNPSVPWINGCENDKRTEDPACHCPVCLSWDTKNAADAGDNPWLIPSSSKENVQFVKSISDRYARFWLALQKEGRKHDPEAIVFGLAYADYTEPPVETRLNDGILVGVVPKHKFPFSPDEQKKARAVWDGWAKTGARLFLRPNYTLEGYSLPYLSPHQLAEEYRYAWRHGMIATDFDAMPSTWGMQGVTSYVLGRLTAHPEMDADAILDEYGSAFGNAADEIKKYIKFWETVTSGVDLNKPGGWATMARSGDETFTPERFSEGRAMLQEALEKAKGDREVEARILFLKVWLDHAEMTMKVLSAYKESKAEPSNTSLSERLTNAQVALDRFRQENIEVLYLAELVRLNQVEQWAGWRRTIHASPLKDTQ